MQTSGRRGNAAVKHDEAGRTPPASHREKFLQDKLKQLNLNVEPNKTKRQGPVRAVRFLVVFRALSPIKISFACAFMGRHSEKPLKGSSRG